METQKSRSVNRLSVSDIAGIRKKLRKAAITPQIETRSRQHSIDKKEPVNWEKIGDSEILARAQAAIDENGIPDLETFRKTYRGIHYQLVKRALSFEAVLVFVAEEKKTFKSWKELSDNEVLTRAQQTIDGKGFTDWDSFGEVYRGIRAEIFRRGLSGNVLNFSRTASA